MTRPINVFLSYAHADAALMDVVRRQLSVCDRQKIIAKWVDRSIRPGAAWRKQIHQGLTIADVILWFVSPAFFESDYSFDIEMREALRRHAAGTATVIPIIIRPCMWQAAPFAQLQALPTNAKPLSTWANLDEGWLVELEADAVVASGRATG